MKPCPRKPSLAPEQALALQLLSRRFPDVPVWFGHVTRSWWAMIGGRLLEATTAEELGGMLDTLEALNPRRDSWPVRPGHVKNPSSAPTSPAKGSHTGCQSNDQQEFR